MCIHIVVSWDGRGGVQTAYMISWLLQLSKYSSQGKKINKVNEQKGGLFWFLKFKHINLNGKKILFSSQTPCLELQEFRILRNPSALLCWAFSTSWPANHSTWQTCQPCTVLLLQIHASETGLQEFQESHGTFILL